MDDPLNQAALTVVLPLHLQPLEGALGTGLLVAQGVDVEGPEDGFGRGGEEVVANGGAVDVT